MIVLIQTDWEENLPKAPHRLPILLKYARCLGQGRLKIISSGGDEVKLTTQGFDHFG